MMGRESGVVIDFAGAAGVTDPRPWTARGRRTDSLVLFDGRNPQPPMANEGVCRPVDSSQGRLHA